ncbi:MAG: glucose-1-phosphate cytidylyltransferase [Deltaproteobacteria bacterium]|nr:glucose-1-phosphate cytidylyltransferase [Deltaproteobacteria bacterium]
MNLQVVILCGGLGTRLREETEYRPKPMVKIGGKPILWHIMKIYAHYGINSFILCLGYKGEMIKEYFYNYEILNNDFTIELGKQTHINIHNNYQEKGWQITLADTGDRALKGARIKRIEKYIELDQFMMTYGDGLTNIDLHSLLDFHNQHGKLATVTGINPASRFGELKLCGNNVECFNEKPQKGPAKVNGGFFIFNRGIFDYLTSDDNCDLEVGPLEKIAEKGQLMAYDHHGFWACMDTIRDMEYLNKLWDENKAAWKIW